MCAKKISFSNDEYLDFDLVGISSREKEFRMAWLLNRELDWQLELKAPIELTNGNQKSSHDMYEYTSEINHFVIRLLTNRSVNGVLLPEFAHMEFLLKIQGADEQQLQEWVKRIRGINDVLGVFSLSNESIKNIEHLIFD